MRFIMPFACTFICAFALPAPLQAQENPIVARADAFVTAFNAGDASAVAEFYAEDSAIFPPQSGNIVGREAIAAHYARAFRSGVEGLEMTILEIRAHGAAAAVEIGETMVSLGEQRIHGRYLHVWTREGEGSWLLSRDIYNVIEVR